MLRRRVSELEAGAIQQEREAGDRVRALERDLRLAKDEAEECRRIVSELEEERMALQERVKPKVLRSACDDGRPSPVDPLLPFLRGGMCCWQWLRW